MDWVRRHGRGNWDTILRDLKLTFSNNKTPEDLNAKWREEQLKFLHESSIKLSESVNGQGFSDTKHETDNLAQVIHNTFVPGSSRSSCFPGASNGGNLSCSGGAGSSKLNKLPHWMQDALIVPPAPSPPSTVSPILIPTASALFLGVESKKEASEKPRQKREF